MNQWRKRCHMNKNLKIDEIDVKILKALLQDPRTSFAEIARDCGLSVPSIYNRFDLLRKSGIINGSIIQIDPRSVGYNCVAILTIQGNMKDEKAILDFLDSMNITSYNYYLTGSGFLGFTIAKGMDELSRTIEKLKHHPSIKEVLPVVWVNTTHIDHPENLIIPKINLSYIEDESDADEESTNDCVETYEGETHARKKLDSGTNLDDIDLSLVRILTNNARISFNRLSSMLGISTNTVINRYKKLRKNVLKVSSITVNLEKLGYIGSAVMRIKVKEGFFVQETFDKILQIPNIIIGIQIFEGHGILVIAPFRSFNELESIQQKIVDVPGVSELTLSIDKPFTKWPFNVVSNMILKDMQTC